ncbi:MAG: hypothetical protein ACYSYL_00085 [Planctomycetota bacterium]
MAQSTVARAVNGREVVPAHLGALPLPHVIGASRGCTSQGVSPGEDTVIGRQLLGLRDALQVCQNGLYRDGYVVDVITLTQPHLPHRITVQDRIQYSLRVGQGNL